MSEYGPQANLLEAGSCFGELGVLCQPQHRTATVIGSSSVVIMAMISNSSIKNADLEHTYAFEDEIANRVETLRLIAEFKRFGADELFGIAYRMTSQRIATGSDVFRVGQKVAGVYILISGEVQLAVPVRMTGRTTKFEIPAPGFVGLEDMLSVATGKVVAYAYCATATKDSQVLFIDKKSINDLSLMSLSPMKKAGSKRSIIKRLSNTLIAKPSFTKHSQKGTPVSTPPKAGITGTAESRRPEVDHVDQAKIALSVNTESKESSIEQLCILAKLFPSFPSTPLPTALTEPLVTASKYGGEGSNSFDEMITITDPSEMLNDKAARGIFAFPVEELCLNARLNTLSFSPPAYYSSLAGGNNIAYRNACKYSQPREKSPRQSPLSPHRQSPFHPPAGQALGKASVSKASVKSSSKSPRLPKASTFQAPFQAPFAPSTADTDMAHSADSWQSDAKVTHNLERGASEHKVLYSPPSGTNGARIRSCPQSVFERRASEQTVYTESPRQQPRRLNPSQYPCPANA
jgi:CRP-like cAMP-binding protein